MKPTNIYAGYLQSIWKYFTNIIKAIISGIPSNRVDTKPNQKSKVIVRDEEIRQDSEIHHHRPHSKPVVEKQTLLKESKKAKMR